MQLATLSIVSKQEEVPSFDQFWSLQVKKVGKKPARMVWDRLSDADKIAAIKEFPKHLAYWSMTGRTIELFPDPRTWLYQERWTDEIPSIDFIGRNGSNGSSWMKTEAGVIAEFRRRGKEPPMGKSIDECRQILMREQR
jgi:cephalosporin-C deacetylase-like acetyl esterase